jgi:hypothetical protein
MCSSEWGREKLLSSFSLELKKKNLELKHKNISTVFYASGGSMFLRISK